MLCQVLSILPQRLAIDLEIFVKRCPGFAPTDPTSGRQAAWELLCQYTKSESLRKHALAVEACMRAYARRFGEGGEGQEKWGVVGLIHDFDYEMYPNAPDHPLKGSEILRERGYSEEIRRAILGHATYTGVPRDSKMAKALFACDELCGFVSAVADIRPNKLAELEGCSV